MGKSFSMFTEEEKAEIVRKNDAGSTQKELAKQFGTSATTIFYIVKEHRGRVRQMEEKKKIEEAAADLEKILGAKEKTEHIQDVPLNIADYQALYKLNTDQTKEIERLETELKATIGVLEKEAEKSIEKDKEIAALKERISELEKPKKGVEVQVNALNFEMVKEWKTILTDLIFDPRVNKDVRKQYAFKVIETEK